MLTKPANMLYLVLGLRLRRVVGLFHGPLRLRMPE